MTYIQVFNNLFDFFYKVYFNFFTFNNVNIGWIFITIITMGITIHAILNLQRGVK